MGGLSDDFGVIGLEPFLGQSQKVRLYECFVCSRSTYSFSVMSDESASLTPNSRHHDLRRRKIMTNILMKMARWASSPT